MKLLAYDDWGCSVNSNDFMIKKDINHDLIATNTFGPLIIFVNHKKLFQLPKDLFLSENNELLLYSLTIISCTSSSKLEAKVEYSKDYSSLYLYLFSSKRNNCKLLLAAADSHGQSVEVGFDITVKDWASKDWFEWTSELESDWIKCVNGFILEDLGAWRRKYTFIPTLKDSFINICGGITMIILLLHAVLTLKFGIRFLDSYEFVQTLIIFSTSSIFSSQDIIDYLSWIQFAKLDLGFIYLAGLLPFVGWKVSYICYYIIVHY